MPPEHDLALVGVDGCRGGWLAVRQAGEILSVELWADLEPLFGNHWDAACIDMPVGLKSRDERRLCDIEARLLLGKRRSSIFFAPCRNWLQAREYEEVRCLGVSLQTFYLLPKVRELDERVTPESQSFLHEGHPELAFASRSDQPLETKKKPVGRAQREQILRDLGSKFVLSDWATRFKRSQVALDDLLDAAILLEVARTAVDGDVRRVGGLERDSRGLKMEICF